MPAVARSACLAQVVDGDDERNRNPKAELDEGEFIEVMEVPVPSLMAILEQ